ncbi:hypothetical protein LTR94_021434 [Friedmanniomyces endolithicus]|nr:hypothetical protein LTR94_021434 [Friedmanniomyces endolithicus]
MPRLSIAVITAVLALAGLPAQAQSPNGALNVEIDRSARVQLRGAAASVIVANPQIADVTVVDANTLFIVGKGYGVTEVVAVDGVGRTLFQREIVVTGGSTGSLGLVFITDAVAENALLTVSREIRTGEAQAKGLDQAGFKQAFCDQMSVFKSDCAARATVDVRVVAKFSDNIDPPKDENGVLDLSKTGYDPGAAQNLVVARVWYKQPMIVPALTQLARDETGVSAVEFALIAPVMILFYAGMVDLCQGYMAVRRTSHVAASVADLTAQSRDITKADIDNVFLVGPSIMAPFAPASLEQRLGGLGREWGPQRPTHRRGRRHSR